MRRCCISVRTRGRVTGCFRVCLLRRGGEVARSPVLRLQDVPPRRCAVLVHSFQDANTLGRTAFVHDILAEN